MPKISVEATIEIRALVCGRLEDWFPPSLPARDGSKRGRLNMSHAMKELGGSEANRRFLVDFCYAPRSTQVTEGKLAEIVDLLSRRDPTFTDDVGRIRWSEDGKPDRT